MEWFHGLAEWTTSWAQTPAGPWALFLVALAEASFFPVPPDLLLMALDLIQPERGFLLAGICTLGSAIGGSIGYATGKFGGRPILKRFISQAKIDSIQDRFHRNDAWTIFIAGFTPIPYKVFAIAAGVFQLRFWRFFLMTVLSRGLRFFMVSGIIFVFHEQASRIIKEHFNIVTIVIAVIAVAGFLVVKRAADGAPRDRMEPND